MFRNETNKQQKISNFFNTSPPSKKDGSSTERNKLSVPKNIKSGKSKPEHGDCVSEVGDSFGNVSKKAAYSRSFLENKACSGAGVVKKPEGKHVKDRRIVKAVQRTAGSKSGTEKKQMLADFSKWDSDNAAFNTVLPQSSVNGFSSSKVSRSSKRSAAKGLSPAPKKSTVVHSNSNVDKQKTKRCLNLGSKDVGSWQNATLEGDDNLTDILKELQGSSPEPAQPGNATRTCATKKMCKRITHPGSQCSFEMDACFTKLKDAKLDKKISQCLAPKEITSIQGYNSDKENGMELERNMLNDPFEDLISQNDTNAMDQILSEELNKLNTGIEKADVTSSKYIESAHYGRHAVISVSGERGSLQQLCLKDENDESFKTAILHGFWADTRIVEGDIVNVIGDFVDKVCNITDSENYIIVNPDLLISGTSVVSSLQCMRRAVLNERFKGCDGANKYMLHGSIIHSFFQEVLKRRIYSNVDMVNLSREITSDIKYLHDMYNLQLPLKSVQEEVGNYIPKIMQWIEKYYPEKNGETISINSLKVSRVVDIEENIWSPRYGVKGKIDLTVETKLGHNNRVIPLELKTGKASFSAEHKGQVTLYSMMLAERRPDPEAGLLLYLKQPVMETVPANHLNKRGLIQLRNEMAHFLQHELSKDGQLGNLPVPISSNRTCSQCPQLINCTAYQKIIEKWEAPNDHVMNKLVNDTLSHLKHSHLGYFHHWCKLLTLELNSKSEHSEIRNIWCKSAIEREQNGQCISGMVLAGQPVKQLSHGGQIYFLHEFRRSSSGIAGMKSLKDGGMNVNDSIILGAENESLVAVCMGHIKEMHTNTVCLALDRDLTCSEQFSKLVFRIDKMESTSVMLSNYTNLTKLLENKSDMQKLRKIIIDLEKPRFNLTMSKTTLEKVKHIFKNLNKPQKTAVLKVLMSEDYTLIKGYPGTGKTSTIVSLVRILVVLGYSVLLTSYTNSAVDNILLKLLECEMDFVRIGQYQKIHPSIQACSATELTSHCKSDDDLQKFYESKQIVATTCFGTNHALFNRRHFDVCVIDEATQVLQPTCFGPLFSSSKFVLVGDSQQLPPVVRNRTAKNLGMDESLFKRLENNGATYELTLQYRMNCHIMALSNQLVYNGALQCGNQTVADSTLSTKQPKDCPEWLKLVLDNDLERSVVFLDTVNLVHSETQNSAVTNKTEAEVISCILQAFVSGGVRPSDIGIISLYRQQVSLLRDQTSKMASCSQVEVNTVDQYQGRDKSLIIVSFVKVGDDATVSDILKDKRRLNVAITRAKHKLVLVGHSHTLEKYKVVQELLYLVKNVCAPHSIK